MKDATAHIAIFFASLLVSPAALGAQRDAAKVAALDTQYQAAVKSNDYAAMAQVFGNHFVLVIGTGRVYTKADLLGAARSATRKWEHQEEIAGSRTVRVWGDTAVVTAKLWIKGAFNGRSIDEKVWFSDTYVRTSAGWKYVFGQASNPVS